MSILLLLGGVGLVMLIIGIVVIVMLMREDGDL